MQPQTSVQGPTAGRSSASGNGGQLRQSDSDVEELDNPKILRAVAKKHGKESTQSLVAAYNATTAKDERGVLLHWLRQYNRRNQDCSRPEAVLEYAELAKIVPRTGQELAKIVPRTGQEERLLTGVLERFWPRGPDTLSAS